MIGVSKFIVKLQKGAPTNIGTPEEQVEKRGYFCQTGRH